MSPAERKVMIRKDHADSSFKNYALARSGFMQGDTVCVG